MDRNTPQEDEGRALRMLRERAGLSQAELGEKVNASQQQIHKLETGERRMTVAWLRRLAGALDCHPSELLGPAFVLADHQRALLGLFAVLDESDQRQLLRIGRTFEPPGRTAA